MTRSSKEFKTQDSHEQAKAGAKAKRPQSQPLIQLTLDQKIDILGVVLVGVGGLTILSMLSSQQGDVPRQWIAFLRDIFGLGFFVVPIVLLPDRPVAAAALI